MVQDCNVLLENAKKAFGLAVNA